jgi:hypothetical protein
MATSGTYTFNPSLGEMTLYAYNLIGVRNTAVLQEHMEAARMASNMMLSRWANQGVNLWAVDLQTVPLVQGQATYSVPSNTVVMLDAYMEIDNGSGSPIDRIILPISRTEYASYPNKEQQGFTTTFWFDRLISPTVTLWPVPDGTSAQYLKYYRVRQLQDADLQSGQQVEIPYLWLEAFAYGLAERLAIIWSPDKVAILKPMADESYQIAAMQNIETAQQYISPMISGYFR